MGDFKQLKVWQRSREVVKIAYVAAGALPRSEHDHLGSQIRRAAVSVSANIAEGCGRQSGRDQARCYRIALGSARELESLIIVADDLEMLRTGERDEILTPVEEVERMLMGLIRHCKLRDTGNRERKSTPDPSPPSRD